MAPMSLPPGFRFHLTDEELAAYYLDRKISGRTLELEIIPEVDLYNCEPWDLPDKSFLPSKDMDWCFYSPRDKKYPNGSRTNRATRAGYWKATGKDRTAHSEKRTLGMKKTLVYYRGRAPHGIRTNWIKKEMIQTNSFAKQNSYALCRIFKQNIQIPKTRDGVENNVAKGVGRVLEEQLFGDCASGTEISRASDVEVEDEKFNTFSSDVTQGTPDQIGMPDHYQAPDDANSSANLPSLGVHFSSNLNQKMQMPDYTNLQYQVPYPPLELEDFPQIIISETKLSKTNTIDEYMKYDKYRDYMNRSLEEIFSLCSSQDNSVPRSIQD